jgi:CSLREA domain-containing protein
VSANIDYADFLTEQPDCQRVGPPQTGPTFTVDTTVDTNRTCDEAPGDCSLREAINAANANPGKDTIAFNIAGPAPYTFRPSEFYPSLAEAVIIDGTTEPDYSEVHQSSS